MAVKKIKLGNKYKVTLETTCLSGADKLGLKLGDEIDAGDGRFMVCNVGNLRLIEPLRDVGTTGIVACLRHLTKSGKHELQVGDTITVKTGISVGHHDTDRPSKVDLYGKDRVITAVTKSGTYRLEDDDHFWAKEWLTFKAPKPYVAPTTEKLPPATYDYKVVDTCKQPTNPFDRKDLVIPEWATHAAHNGDGGWFFSNMLPKPFRDDPFFALSLDEREGFKWYAFNHDYKHPNWKDSVVERYIPFKVGELVRVKDVAVGTSIESKLVEGLSQSFVKEMISNIGKTFPVKEINSNLLWLEGDGHWAYLPDWLERVDQSELTETVSPPIEPSLTATETREYSHYFKDVSKLDTIDVYQVLDLFGVTNPCLQHIVKKALVTGGRTAGKSFSQDLREIRDTAIRAVEMDQS